MLLEQGRTGHRASREADRPLKGIRDLYSDDSRGGAPDYPLPGSRSDLICMSASWAGTSATTANLVDDNALLGVPLCGIVDEDPAELVEHFCCEVITAGLVSDVGTDRVARRPPTLTLVIVFCRVLVLKQIDGRHICVIPCVWMMTAADATIGPGDDRNPAVQVTRSGENLAHIRGLA